MSHDMRYALQPITAASTAASLLPGALRGLPGLLLPIYWAHYCQMTAHAAVNANQASGSSVAHMRSPTHQASHNDNGHDACADCKDHAGQVGHGDALCITTHNRQQTSRSRQANY
jgi:hypothetical protein